MDFNKYDPLKNSSINQTTCHDQDGHAELFTTQGADPLQNLPHVPNRLPSSSSALAAAPASEVSFQADDRQPGEGHHPEWMTSSEVIRLIEYARKCHDQGIVVYEKGGKVGLRFKPGLTATDLKSTRGDMAKNILELLRDAANDLIDMTTRGVSIPLLTRFKATAPEPQPGAGPP